MNMFDFEQLRKKHSIGYLFNKNNYN
jgi:hypothetical protein